MGPDFYLLTGFWFSTSLFGMELTIEFDVDESKSSKMIGGSIGVLGRK